MTTYQLTESDKAVSHRAMRRRLYFRFSLISSLEATDQECAVALRTFDRINEIGVLWNVVGTDGFWAAQQVLGQ